MKLQQFWLQVKEVTLASMKARYRKTMAGFIWVIMSPLLMFGVQSLVFKKFLKLDTPDYYLFLLGGLLPWIFASSTLQMGTPLLLSQSQLLKSFRVNPLVLLFSLVLDNFINFLVTFILILIPVYLDSGKDLSFLFLTPVALIPLFIGVTALTTVFAVINVFFRDTNFIMGFVLSLLFFLTPVFYPKDFVPENFLWLVRANPFGHFIEPFRALLHENSLEVFVRTLALSFAISLALVAWAAVTWKRKRNGIYHAL